MRFLLTMSLSALLGACAVDAPLQPGVDETVAIQEAVFRYQFQHNASSRKQAADFYCLGIVEKKNPRPELMERFAGHAPAVVPVSECRADAGSGVTRDSTSGHGLIFTVGDIKWINGSEVEVAGGYYEGGLSASGNVFRVKRIDGVWTVVEDRMEWIS
jgi:hypothetical protein